MVCFEQGLDTLLVNKLIEPFLENISKPRMSQKPMPDNQRKLPTGSTPTAWAMVVKHLVMAGNTGAGD
jgi:hypothetical protein